MVTASLALLLVASLGSPRADGCGLLADTPHACCDAEAAPRTPVVASCCVGETSAPASTPCRPSSGSVNSECSCGHAPVTPPAAATGVAAPIAPELEAQLVAPGHAPDAGRGLGPRQAELGSVSSAHDPPLFLLDCAYLI